MGSGELVYKIFCDGNLNKLERNTDYVSTLSLLEQDIKSFNVGVDIPADMHDGDKAMMCWFSQNEDGSLNYEGYKYLETK